MPVPPPSFLVAEWDDGARLLSVAYAAPSTLDGRMAREACAWLDAVIAEAGAGFGLLVDARNVLDATPEYRREMAAWFRSHRRDARMAVFGLTPFIRVMALLFATATRMPVKIAADREEALRWLAPMATS